MKKLAFITGAGIRIGRAIAQRLMKADYSVILHANSSFEQLQEWTDECGLNDRIVCKISADLSSESDQEKLINKISSHTNKLDLLVNNASVFFPQKFEQISRADYQLMQSVNVEAPFFLTQKLLPLLVKSDDPSVINIGDAMWQRPCKQFSHYSLSKAALEILTRALAVELAPKIRVNSVSPGAILFQEFFSPKTRENVLNRIPFKRLGNPEDIANAVLFLANEAYITGHSLAVDGGRSIAS